MAIYQNDEGNPDPIQKWGCYYYSFLTEIFKRFPNIGELTNARAISFWEEELKDGNEDVDETMEMVNPQDLANDLVGINKVKFLGKVDLTVNPSFKPKANQWVVEKWRNEYKDENGKNKVVEHFTLPDYDPWKGGSRTKREGKLIGYRLFEMV